MPARKAPEMEPISAWLEKEAADFDRAMKPLLEETGKEFDRVIESLKAEWKPYDIEVPNIAIDDIKPIDFGDLGFNFDLGNTCDSGIIGGNITGQRAGGGTVCETKAKKKREPKARKPSPGKL